MGELEVGVFTHLTCYYFNGFFCNSSLLALLGQNLETGNKQEKSKI